MEGAEPRTPTRQEDDQISMILVDTIEKFQESVEDILEQIEQDESFSEMTKENYDKKKSYLTMHLTELSRLHRILANEHLLLIKEVSKNSSFGGSLNTSKWDDLESSSSLSSDFDSESISKLLSSPVKDGALEKANVVDEPSSDNMLQEDETTTLKQKIQENESEITTEKSHLELQKEVADLKLVISESDLKMKTMEEEIEKLNKCLSIAKDTISSLKGEKSSKVFRQNQMMKYELQSGQKLMSTTCKELSSQLEKYHRLKEQADSRLADITVRDDQIKKLNTKNDQYKSEILRLEETLKSIEDIWNQDVIKLKVQLNNKSKSFDDLKKQLNTVRFDKNKISGRLETLKEEKCSQDKLIQELETRLNALEVEHERVVSSLDNTEKLNNELTLKVLELKSEVERLREVVSVITEEKIEVIRQLSFSLEHYMSKYKQLLLLYAANKTSCLGLLNCMKTQ